MTSWDPNSYGDSADAWKSGASQPEESLELPLELFFAEDRGAPEAVAARESLTADVLGRVESSRGFVSSRGRRLIRFGRVVLTAVGLGVLVSAAVADRLGVAPWSEAHVEGPVSALVSSASEETADEFARVRELRDGLLRVVTIPVEPRGDAAEPTAIRGGYAVLVRDVTPPAEPERARHVSGPYLWAEGLEPSGRRGSIVIRFEDGFSMPVMAAKASTDGSRSELFWPNSREVTASLVSLEAGAADRRPQSLAPAWFAKTSSGPSR